MVRGVLIFILVLWAPPGYAADPLPPLDSLVIEAMPIAVEIAGTTYRLQGLMVRPQEAGRLPLAVLTHGSCGSDCRARRSPDQLKNQAKVFARWGYAVFILMRRDNGESDGAYAEGFGGCDTQAYDRAANASADDLHAAINVVKKMPYVDPGRIIAVGQSGGGIGVVALAARPVSGLRAVINFAGGRGGGCIRRGGFNEEKMIGVFRAYGERSRLPGLWIYTQNDDHWGAERPQAWHRAFTGAGGKAEYHLLAPFRKKGHGFFYKRSAIPIWRPIVERFLGRVGLPARP